MSFRVRLAVVGFAALIATAGVTALALASSSTTARVVAAPQPSGVTVTAGPPLKAPPAGVVKQADALAFFPRVATIAAGQSVTFQLAGFHTITFGNPKSFPLLVPTGKKQPALPDAAGASLWWGGAVPALSLNPRDIPQLGGGTIASPAQVRSSGLLRVLSASGNKPPKPYTLTFLKPGTYHFFCVVHPGMHGVIRVVPSTSTPPAAAKAAAATQTQLTHVIADVKSVQSKNPTEKLAVWVGTGKLSGAEVTAFYPKQLVVNTGDTVKFVSHDPADIHTVTFGPRPYTGQIENAFIGKTLAVDPFGAYPSEPPNQSGPPTPVVYNGENHGNGYINSGVLFPYTAHQTPHVFRVTFTKPGVYHFECIIHQHMDGTIVVR